MFDNRPRCPQHPDHSSRSVARAGRRVWLCLRCSRDIGEAPVESAYGWEEWVAELGEEYARAKALGLERAYIESGVLPAPPPPKPSEEEEEEEEDQEEAPAIVEQPPAPPVVAAAATTNHRRSPRHVEASPPASKSSTPAAPEQPRIVVTHQMSCKKEPCSCAAKLRAFSAAAHQLAAKTLEDAADLSAVHEEDRESLRGHLQRIAIRLRKGPVC